MSFFLSCRILIFVFSNSFSKIFKWNLRLCHLLFLKFLQKISCMMQIKIPLFLPVNDENSFNQNFFLVRRQSGRVKRHAYSYVFLLRPPLPKARSRGGRQFLFKDMFEVERIKSQKQSRSLEWQKGGYRCTSWQLFYCSKNNRFKVKEVV